MFRPSYVEVGTGQGTVKVHDKENSPSEGSNETKCRRFNITEQVLIEK